MTDTAWKPTPGRDAMTRNGDRVTGLRSVGYPHETWALQGVLDGRIETWRADGRWNKYGIDYPNDLVADWPDADPLPDADAAQHAYWTEADWNDRIVRPAPSGPVVEETVKRIVPGVYGVVFVGVMDAKGLIAVSLRGGQSNPDEGVEWLSKAEVLAAAETLRQIGEAMEGK